MAHSPLATQYIGDNKNQSGAGYRKGKTLIVVHHMAGVLTPVQCNNALKGRGGSIHYAIGNDGSIGYGVDEDNVAWHAGNWPVNQKSIGIETSNCAIGGDWPVSDAAFNSLCKLVADIAKRNNMGTLVFKQNIGYHGLYAATACCGPYLIGKFNQLIETANKINGGQPTPPTPPAPTPGDGFLPAKGYWCKYDKDSRVSQLATFMRKNFPAYTPAAALGPVYGDNLSKSIAQFQTRAKAAGKYNDKIDGMTGPKTYAALQAYGFKYKK